MSQAGYKHKHQKAQVKEEYEIPIFDFDQPELVEGPPDIDEVGRYHSGWVGGGEVMLGGDQPELVEGPPDIDEVCRYVCVKH